MGSLGKKAASLVSLLSHKEYGRKIFNGVTAEKTRKLQISTVGCCACWFNQVLPHVVPAGDTKLAKSLSFLDHISSEVHFSAECN